MRNLRGAVAWTVLALLTCPAVPAEAQAPPGLSGTIVVANKQAATATFIDLESGRIVGTVPTGQGPHELLVSSDGRRAVVTDYGGQGGGRTLTVLDVASASLERTIELGDFRRPHGAAFLPGDTVVAVTAEASRAVVLVQVTDGEIVGVLETGAEGSHMVAATADGAWLYTGDIGSGTVSELDRRRLVKTRSFEAAPQPEAITVSPDGGRVFVGSNSEGTVSEIRTDDGRRREIADGFGWPYRIFLTPGVEQILVPDLSRQELRFFDGASYEELGRLDFAGGGPQGLTLHPNGRHLFLSLSAEGRIAIVDVHERSVVGYLPAGDSPDGIGYSPLTVSR